MKQMILMVALLCATLTVKAQIDSVEVFLIGRPTISIVSHSSEVKDMGRHPLGSYYGRPGSRLLYDVTKEYRKKGLSLVEDIFILSTKHLYVGAGANISLFNMYIHKRTVLDEDAIYEVYGETAGGWYFTAAPRLNVGVKYHDIALKGFIEKEYQITKIDLPDNKIAGLTLAYKGITFTYATRKANHYIPESKNSEGSPRRVNIFGLGYRF